MGKKKNKVNVEGGEEQHQQPQNNEDKKKDESAAADRKQAKSINVVLKVDLHCEGCASKVVKCIRGFEGVEAVKCEGDANKLTVTGDVDPVKLREKVEEKTHKKVELISPVPKKENKENTNNNNNNNNKSDNKGNEEKNDDNNKEKEKKKKKNNKKKESKDDDKPSEEKQKSKEVPVTTAVMKVHFHCEGCIQKILKLVTKTAGYQEMKIDRQKELLTVTGAMDMNALAECLKKHLKKDVEIVPPKKDGEKKDKGGGGDGDGGGGKGKGKGKGGGDEKAENGGGGGGEMEGNKMQVQFGYPHFGPYMHGPGPGPGYVGGPDQFQFQYQYYPYHAHAPQMFSDENPNACSIM